jgi:hypothetical protein
MMAGEDEVRYGTATYSTTPEWAGIAALPAPFSVEPKPSGLSSARRRLA